MKSPYEQYYEKRGEMLVKNLQSRHFDAYYCATKEEALAKALELIPTGSTISWGGCMSAQQIGLVGALKAGDYKIIDRYTATSPEEMDRLTREGMFTDFFLTGANGLSMDGQMVNIDGTGNRLAAINFGPKTVLVIAGMNKVVDTLEDAMQRARTVAAPLNKMRFPNVTPCGTTGTCADCKSVESICNQILVTRNCRPVGRIKFILVGESLGL